MDPSIVTCCAFVQDTRKEINLVPSLVKKAYDITQSQISFFISLLFPWNRSATISLEIAPQQFPIVSPLNRIYRTSLKF